MAGELFSKLATQESFPWHVASARNRTTQLAPNPGLLLIGGNFYGTAYGGAYDNGTVFKVDSHGHLATLYSFKGRADGLFFNAPLISDSAGNLYGTAFGGGKYGGTVFRLDPSGKLRVIYAFNLDDGYGPVAGLTWDAAGNLYGTTAEGGAGCESVRCGTIFKLTRIHGGSWTYSTVYNFNGVDGGQPGSALFLDNSGSFYGTTATGSFDGCYSGQRPGCGVVYKFTP